MRFSPVVYTLTVLALSYSACSRPVETSCNNTACFEKPKDIGHQLGIRAPIQFPKGPHEPEPRPAEPKLPEGPIVPGSSSQPASIGIPTYHAPASFGAFPQKGQQLNDALGSAYGPDTDNGYSSKIDEYYVVPDNKVNPFTGDDKRTGINLKIPFSDTGLQDNDQWMLREILGKDIDEDPTSVVYHNRDQQAMVVTDIFNDKLGEKFDLSKKIFHSELTFQGWKAAPGRDIAKLKYVVVAQISNVPTRAIINDARNMVAGSRTAGTEVTFMARSSNDAEQQAFYALAGTDNGKFVFRMLNDHHTDFNNLKVVSVHTWADLPGDISGPVLIWELA